MIELICKKEPRDENGVKVMSFTKGETYFASENIDPEGWVVVDDEGIENDFFNLNTLFKICSLSQ